MCVSIDTEPGPSFVNFIPNDGVLRTCAYLNLFDLTQHVWRQTNGFLISPCSTFSERSKAYLLGKSDKLR